MNNRRLLGIGIAAVVALLVIFFYSLPDADKGSKFDWEETSWRNEQRKSYSQQNNQPWGGLALFRLLSHERPGDNLVVLNKNLTEEIPLDTAGGPRVYLFVGEGMFLDSADTRHLVKFVERGNTAMILSKTIPFDLMFYIYYNECNGVMWDDYSMFQTGDSIKLSLDQPPGAPSGKFFFARRNKLAEYNWAYIKDRYLCEELPYRSLGRINDSLTNFASFQVGKGYFLLHTNPLAFTNFHLLRPDGKAYAQSVLSHLPVGNTLYWDEFSRIPEPLARRRNENRNRNRDRNRSGEQDQASLPETHALTYILEQEPLRWAWYLLLGMGIIYLLFRARRRQRLIPVVKPNENSSYEFISTMANLHFREQNYQNISVQAMRLFLIHIKEKYGLVATLDHRNDLVKHDEHFMRRLTQFSGVPEQEIQHLFNHYNELVRFRPEQQQMVHLHLAIEQFWKKAK